MAEAPSHERDPLVVLWLSPLCPHYRLRKVARLTATKPVDMTLITAATPEADGYRVDQRTSEAYVRVEVPHWRFALSPGVYRHLTQFAWRRRPDVVICPNEKTFAPLLLYARLLSFVFGYRLMAYCHESTRSRDGRTPGGSRATPFDLLYTTLAFRLYDRMIFYTRAARDASVAAGIAPPRKAYYASNTLDTNSIWEHAPFAVNRGPDWTIAFIGRLDARKRLDLLLEYYRSLKQQHPSMRLLIIGDGPEAPRIRAAADSDPSIIWRGAVTEERLIAEDMRAAHVVMLPGASGLSIVHALAYGKPYLTCGGPGAWHGPEISYLVDGWNGMLLTGDVPRDVARIVRLLGDERAYEECCRNAYQTARNLSIDNWCDLFDAALRGRPADGVADAPR